MNDVHLVLFDCDGTLVDSQHMIHAAMCRAFDGCGFALPERERVRGVIGLQLDTAIARLAPDLDEANVALLAEGYKAAFFALREEPDAKARDRSTRAWPSWSRPCTRMALSWAWPRASPCVVCATPWRCTASRSAS